MTDSVAVVTVDLDGTLCEYRESTAEVLARSFDELGVDPFFSAGQYRDRLFAQVVTDGTRAERRERAFVDLAEAAGRDPAVGRRLAALFGSMRDHGDVVALPGAFDAVESLGERYTLAVVTNGGPETTDPKLDALGIRDAFEMVVHGGYDAAPKPEPGAFHEVLYSLEVPPGRAVHVGDSVRRDIRGADAAGIQVALVTGEKRHLTAPDYVVESMRELVDPPWE